MEIARIPHQFLIFTYLLVIVIFFSHSNLQILELTCISNELCNIYDWFCDNRLSLNIAKATFIFHHPQKTMTNAFNLSFNGKPINQVKSIKYFSVLLDSRLNLKDHIHHVSKNYLEVLVFFVSSDTLSLLQVLVQLYFTIVFPFLSYCCLIWGILITVIIIFYIAAK